MSSFLNVILSRSERGNKIIFFLDAPLIEQSWDNTVFKKIVYDTAWHEANCTVNGFKPGGIEFVLPISKNEMSTKFMKELNSFLDDFIKKSEISWYTISFGMMLVPPEVGENSISKNEVIQAQIKEIVTALIF